LPNGSSNGGSNDSHPPAATAGTGFEQREIELLRERLADKDARLADKDSVIADLRARLDHEVAERRLLMSLLIDQSRRSWWRRWFR
jgi:hypothetical protein